MGFGSFGCNCCPDGNCNCDFSELYVCLADGMTVELAGTPFVVTNQSITWSIKVICDADGQSQVFELPAVSCNATDCQELDLTGTFVGSCDVGVITFGNDATCCGTACTFPCDYPRGSLVGTFPGTNVSAPSDPGWSGSGAAINAGNIYLADEIAGQICPLLDTQTTLEYIASIQFFETTNYTTDHTIRTRLITGSIRIEVYQTVAAANLNNRNLTWQIFKDNTAIFGGTLLAYPALLNNQYNSIRMTVEPTANVAVSSATIEAGGQTITRDVPLNSTDICTRITSIQTNGQGGTFNPPPNDLAANVSSMSVEYK